MGRGGDVEVHDGFEGPVDGTGIDFCGGIWLVSVDFPEVEKVAKGEACEEDAQEAG
jgi:hypothetical protein